MFKTTAAIVAISAAAFSQAALADQVLLPAQSAVNFEAKQMGVPLKGHFKKFDAKIAFDAA
ncbi:MAG: polyisoprenoid-binding protein, partial [Comamonas sp.]